MPLTLAVARRPSRKRSFGAGLTLALTLWAGPAAAQSADTIVRGWIERLSAKGAVVEPGSITYTKGTDTLEMRAVKLRPAAAPQSGGGELNIGRLAFVGLQQRPDGGISARQMSLSGLEGSSAANLGRLSVSEIEARNIALPDFTSLAYDVKRPFASTVGLLKLVASIKADGLRIGKISAGLEVDAKPVSIDYDGLDIQNVQGGRIDKIVYGPLKVVASSNDGPVQISTGRVEVVALDFDPYLRAFDDAAYAGGRGDGQWREALKSAVLDGVKVEAGPARFELARIALNGFRVRQFDEPLGARFDAAAADPKVFDKDPEQALRLVLNLYRGLAIKDYAFDGWTLSGPGLDRAVIGRLGIRDLSSDGLGEFRMDGIDVATPQGSLRLATFSFGGLQFPALDDILRAFKQNLDKPGSTPDVAALAPQLGFARLDGFEVGVPDKGTIRIGSASIDLGSYIRAVPTSIRMAVRNVVLPVSFGDAQAREVFAKVGYEDLDLSADLAVRWDATTGDLRIENVGASLANGGALSANATIGGVPRDLFEHPERAQQALPALTLRGIGLAYTDASLVDRVLKLAAAQSGQANPAQLRQGLIAALPNVLKDLKDAQLKARVIAAVTAFLNAPKSLTIATRLAKPLPLLQLVGTAATAPQQLPSVLQIDVVANP